MFFCASAYNKCIIHNVLISKENPFYMANETEQFKKRIHELSETSYTNSQYLFTDFLNEAELSDVLSIAGNASEEISTGKTVICSAFPSGITIYGGHTMSTRCMIRFGSEEAFAYDEPFPISIVHIFPRLAKFADTFTHRDFLGAILNLGIDRKVTGDILTDGTQAWLFAEKKMAEFIKENLDQVKHTHIICEIVDDIPKEMQVHTEHLEFQVQSERIDAIAAQIVKLSRSKVLELFRTQKIFVNGRTMENPSFQPKSGDMISIRGFGKVRYLGTTRLTRKGKCNIAIEKFI